MRGWRMFGRSSGAMVALSLLALSAAGCGTKNDYPPNFAFPSRTDRLVLKSPDSPPSGPNKPAEIEADLAKLDAVGGKTADPTTAPAELRAVLDAYLKESFGTPAAPFIKGDTEALGLTADRLAEGAKLFRRHCLQCHNLTGDGRGSAGLYVLPYPRDFRRGAFKFVSTGADSKPRRADLLRTLAEGLKGTAMPSFGLLPETERELLAGYVTYLSTRGQVEFETLAAALSGTTSDVPSFASGRVKSVVAEWVKANAAPNAPSEPADGEPGSPAHLAAVKRGFDLFTRKADNSCITCHADFGRKPLLRYDVWGLVATPANLTAPTLKAGARPEDVFARVRCGISAVGMPAHPDLTDRQVWDLVRFVKSAPFPRELPEDVRAAIYPSP